MIGHGAGVVVDGLDTDGLPPVGGALALGELGAVLEEVDELGFGAGRGPVSVGVTPVA
jgi:hypothetical protein